MAAGARAGKQADRRGAGDLGTEHRSVPVRLEPRCVPLNSAGTEKLIFDYRDGVYRVAYWRAARPAELRSDKSVPGQQAFDRAAAAGWIPAKGKRMAWRRFACERDTLTDALYRVFADGSAQYATAGTVEAYMRSTAWGGTLP